MPAQGEPTPVSCDVSRRSRWLTDLRFPTGPGTRSQRGKPSDLRGLWVGADVSAPTTLPRSPQYNTRDRCSLRPDASAPELISPESLSWRCNQTLPSPVSPSGAKGTSSAPRSGVRARISSMSEQPRSTTSVEPTAVTIAGCTLLKAPVAFTGHEFMCRKALDEEEDSLSLVRTAVPQGARFAPPSCRLSATPAKCPSRRARRGTL